MYLLKSFLILMFISSSNHSTSQVNIVTIHCPDTVGFVTNMGVTKACEFIFDNESPNLFYVENFSHQSFHDLIYRNNLKLISRTKLLVPSYVPKIHDFIFAWNKNNKLLFYYILKDHKEEKLLIP